MDQRLGGDAQPPTKATTADYEPHDVESLSPNGHLLLQSGATTVANPSNDDEKVKFESMLMFFWF